MNSRRLWNSHQRHKFLGAEASRDILKIRVSEMVFPGVFKRFFPQRMPCCFVRTNARLGTLPSKCPRRSKASDGVKRSTDLTCLNNFMCSMLFKTGAYFLLAVMVERDESRGLRMTNQQVVLAGYRPLLTALTMTCSLRLTTFTMHIFHFSIAKNCM